MPEWKLIAKEATSRLRRLMPVTRWAPQLTKRQAIDDLIGGFIVGVMIVPTSLSWASLAGLPLSCGLSAALVASFAYGTFGQCAALSIGPVAEITTLLISISDIDPTDRINVFQSLGVQVGILSVVLSFIDGGTVIKTIFAKAVGDGYTCAAALLAICVQMKVMFNVTAPPATLIQDVLYTTLKALGQQWSVKCLYAFLLFMVYAMYLIYIKRLKLPLWIPHQLLVVVVSTTITWAFRLDERWGLAIVRDIPGALSLPHFPRITNVIGLGPYTVTITMISFLQMFVIAQRIMPDIDPNAELFASGITNFLVNILSGMPVTNSFGCSSVLMEQHVHTPLTAYGAGSVVLITVIFLTRLGVFYYLPKQALAAIVVASVSRLLDFSGPMQLWRYSKKDAAVWVFTFLLTIFGGITIGVLSGIGLSLIIVVLRIARPRAVSVGFNMATFRYGDLSKDAELLVYPNILMWRFDAPLYFVNIGYFQQKLLQAIGNEIRPIDVVLVTCGKVVDMDAGALASLPMVLESIASSDPCRRRRIILCDIHGRLEQVLLESEALPLYVPEEFEQLSVSQIEAAGKFPVVFKRLEDAIRFAQRCISERYGNVDMAPYPNVSFLTDVVVAAARLQHADGTSALVTVLSSEPAAAEMPALTSPPHTHSSLDHEVTLEAARDDSVMVAHPPDSIRIRHGGNNTLLGYLEKLTRLSKFSPDRELIGAIGVVRHTELTPKQKKKIVFRNRELIQLAFAPGTSGRSRREPQELQEFFSAVQRLTSSGSLEDREEWHRVTTIVRSQPQGLKLQVKGLVESAKDGSFASVDMQALKTGLVDVGTAMLVVKWGGVLTNSGIAEAQMFGEKLFARFFASGDLPLRRLITFSQKITAVASDESRVIDTALVVMNAISQRQVTKQDIVLNNKLMKTLGPITKRLLHEEYKYYEALLHINSRALARHFFHIPGFRPLLTVPLLDRPLVQEESAGGIPQQLVLHNDSGRWSVAEDKMNTSSNKAFFSIQNTDISLVHGSRAALDAVKNCSSIEAFHTPLQVLEELELALRTICYTELPHNILILPLCNHETFEEMRQRYETMLKNFLGAKRHNRPPARGTQESWREGSGLRTAADDDDKGSSSDELGDHLMNDIEGPSELEHVSSGNCQGSPSRSRRDSRRSRHSRAPPPTGSCSESASAAKSFNASEAAAACPQQNSLLRPSSLGTAQQQRYDVSDVSKLRDYGSYDLAYNVGTLRELLGATGACEIRLIIDAIHRMARITENMARVGENVLEGINSSKKFIIGSLVSGGLLERIHLDYRNMALMDEERGVQELLWRAQKLHMAENAGVEQDVRHVMRFFKGIGNSQLPPKKLRRQSWEITSTLFDLFAEERKTETTEQRAFRRTFPFITLQLKRDPPARGDWQRSSCNRSEPPIGDDSHARFYFSSYLHVEGVLQCLFESSTLKGLSYPSREEMELSQQMYMKHLIFKVFRRRNISFTDAEVASAFRRLPLLFVSDVEYDRQQRELRRALASLYHSMYFISMEVFLSLGDSDAADQGQEAFFSGYEDGDQQRPDAANNEDDRRDSEDDSSHSNSEGEGQEDALVAEVSLGSTRFSPITLTTPPPPAASSTPLRHWSASWSSPQTAASSNCGDVRGHEAPFLNSSEAAVVVAPVSPDVASVTSAVPTLNSSLLNLNGTMLPFHYVATADATIYSTDAPMRTPSEEVVRAAAMKRKSSPHEPAAPRRASVTVMKTPQPVRGTEEKMEMRSRACNLTPMRRVHEGLSLNDFQRLMKEVESAVESQRV